jgi:hypothetical protein
VKVDKLAEGGAKSLSLRFYLVSLLPSALLTFLIFTLWASGAPGPDPSIEKAIDNLEALTGAQVALLLVGVVISGVILQPFQIMLVQVFEGYWRPTPIGQLAMDIGIELQRRRMRELEITKQWLPDGGSGESAASEPPPPEQVKSDWAESRLRFYPDVNRLLPTQLGNTLRAAEDRAGERYGLSTLAAWPRLYPHLSDKLFEVINDRRDQLDTAARLCATFLLALVIAVGFLAKNGGRWALIVPSVFLCLAWVSYRAAVAAGELHGQLLETAFDLHRFDLLAALRYESPTDRREEFELNRQVSEFLVYGDGSTEQDDDSSFDEDNSLKPDHPYQHPPPAPTMVVLGQATPDKPTPDGARPQAPGQDGGDAAPLDEPGGVEREAKWLWDAVFRTEKKE